MSASSRNVLLALPVVLGLTDCAAEVPNDTVKYGDIPVRQDTVVTTYPLGLFQIEGYGSDVFRCSLVGGSSVFRNTWVGGSDQSTAGGPARALCYDETNTKVSVVTPSEEDTLALIKGVSHHFIMVLPEITKPITPTVAAPPTPKPATPAPTPPTS